MAAGQAWTSVPFIAIDGMRSRLPAGDAVIVDLARWLPKTNAPSAPNETARDLEWETNFWTSRSRAG